MLFSGQHFLAFLSQASSHFGAGSRTPFDFIQESRIGNQVAPDLKDHLVNFLSQIKNNEQLRELAVPLITSSLLLDHYPPDMHFQENFDMVYGTSIGNGSSPWISTKLIVLGAIVALKLCVMGWSIEKCIERAEHFAKFAFQPRLMSHIPAFIRSIPGFSAFVSFLVSYFADGCYSADYLEEILQEEFGTERSILDCSNATATGTRIGIPVTTIQDTSTCIFTNYNAIGTRPSKCGESLFGLRPRTGESIDSLLGYHALRPKCGLGQVPLWKMYFEPKYIPGIGTFQDGGVRQNDPGNIALQEVAAVFPNSAEPSLVVSLGTGAARVNDVPEMGPSRGLLKDGFIPRLIRAFKLSFGSTIAHKHRSLRRQGSREQYFRFDIEFDHPEPELDDTTRMQEVKERARSAIYESKELDHLARCVVAELFLFELDSIPKKERGRYFCQGRIICRLRAHHTALQVLLEHSRRDYHSHVVSAGLRFQSIRWSLRSTLNAISVLWTMLKGKGWIQ
ncbi:hypothetical protein SS1G_08008 [Sclerotinia sclerotiorum 1980 UF-70]|uniref:PNPLA domain-containing protein n=1 Tax=Sclerotinia sclerotiorum (strain ATCC 18683 / 1980 / Ss-1) TaxID=665079 RepID=A7ERQ4_SCLS1|nr:hypothetical protein SS1G_08008 [Sclerotinia sclerotiorum 1980 UF-70]EDN92146.1 hypothetical protein SS1G_08008 [Sclerotinia sclerotiorum 1980 UF-70]